MKRPLNWKRLGPMLGAAGLLVWGISLLSGLNFWWAALIWGGLLLLNRVLAEIEDRMPGGFWIKNILVYLIIGLVAYIFMKDSLYWILLGITANIIARLFWWYHDNVNGNSTTQT